MSKVIGPETADPSSRRISHVIGRDLRERALDEHARLFERADEVLDLGDVRRDRESDPVVEIARDERACDVIGVSSVINTGHQLVISPCNQSVQ